MAHLLVCYCGPEPEGQATPPLPLQRIQSRHRRLAVTAMVLQLGAARLLLWAEGRPEALAQALAGLQRDLQPRDRLQVLLHSEDDAQRIYPDRPLQMLAACSLLQASCWVHDVASQARRLAGSRVRPQTVVRRALALLGPCSALHPTARPRRVSAGRLTAAQGMDRKGLYGLPNGRF